MRMTVGGEIKVWLPRPRYFDLADVDARARQEREAGCVQLPGVDSPDAGRGVVRRQSLFELSNL